MAKFGREVIDRVRVDESNRVARAANPRRAGIRATRRVIKGTRWLLLRNMANLTRPERARLRDVLAVNRRLWVVYVLKDALKQLWRYRYVGAARRAWDHWYGWAVRSRIPALVAFERNLKAKLPGILAHCRYPLHTGLLEGINNKFKVLKRTAFGFHNDEYFFLKIRAASPEFLEEPKKSIATVAVRLTAPVRSQDAPGARPPLRGPTHLLDFLDFEPRGVNCRRCGRLKRERLD